MARAAGLGCAVSPVGTGPGPLCGDQRVHDTLWPPSFDQHSAAAEHSGV